MLPVSVNAVTCPGPPSAVTQLRFSRAAVLQKKNWSGVNEEQPGGFCFVLF